MQNLGFLFALLPVLKHLYPDKEELRQATLRHLELFNSQPYMVSPIIGAVIRLEEEHAEGRMSTQVISRFKKNIMSGFAALGDSFFWNTLRPVSAAAALIYAYGGYEWAPFVMLAVYNVPHFFVRIHGYRAGLKRGLGIIEEVQCWRVPEVVLWMRKILPVILGIVLFQAVSSTGQELDWGYRALALPAVVACWTLLRKNISPAAILLAIFALSLVGTLVLEK